MKVGSFQITLRILACVLILFPHYVMAGSVNIPGVHGGAIVTSQPVPRTAPTPARTVNIPGFYGSQLTPPPSNTIPDLKGVVQGANVSNPAQNQVIVDQTEQQAIIDWKSFDIGSDASVQFNQTGKDLKGNVWVGTALNRIWSSDPSQIYGSLKADGNIYLINQNGILFGPGAKVNVNSLIASTLNIRNMDFLSNNLLFKYEDYLTGSLNFPNILPFVSNAGEINAADGGYIFLMAPYVENSGLINAPTGQIGLAAGTNVQLVSPSGTNAPRSGFYVIIDRTDLLNPPSTDQNFGNAVNQATGELRSDGGMAGMYGNNVDQWGVIRAVTAYQNKQGQVELRALNRIRTGPDSIIMLPVDATIDPETGRVKTVDDSFDIQPVVDIKGLQKPASVAGDVPVDGDPAKRIELQGIILAPTGIVTMNATDRVYLDVNSQIDVSGVVADLPVPVISDVKLTSVELRDNYAQKSGALPGEKITTTATAGSSIGDLSQVYLTQERTALDRSIGGAMTKNAADGSYAVQTGEVKIASGGGDVIVKEGAVIDISGGVINYAGGPVNTTKLVSGTKIYDISNAPSNIHYDGVLGRYTKTCDRFGISESYSGMYDSGGSPLNRHVDSYTQGGDAGRLTLDAPTIVLDGQINAGVTRGIYQNTWTSSTNPDALALSLARGIEAPRAGTLTIHASSMSIESDPERQSGSISDPEVAPIQTGTTVLSAKTLNAANFGALNLNANLAFTTKGDVGLTLQPGGAFKATAGTIDHEGSIKVSAGSIDLITTGSVPAEQRIVLGSKSSLDVSGERIDNSQTVTRKADFNLGLLNSGSINIKDETDNGAGVFIASGAFVDVSGGYLIDQKGKITGGNAGSLALQGANIMLGGDLRGFALADANGNIKGGSFTLTSKDIRVGPPNTGDVWEPGSETMPVPDNMKGRLNLASDRFDETGFTQITLRSMNNIVVDENTTINPSYVRLNTPQAAQQAGSPSSVMAHETFGSQVADQPDRIKLKDDYAYMAGPSSFSAAAGQDFEGAAEGVGYSNNLVVHNNTTATITVSQGAVIRTTPSAKSLISLQAKGNLDVAGTLDSHSGKITVSSGYGDVTLESTSKITASGTSLPDHASTPKGYDMNYQPLSAGSVALSAAGSLYMNSGSQIDISSGDSKVENRMQTAGGKIVTYQDAGDPGSLSLSYGSNLAWNGTVDVHKANNNGKGGSLTINRTNGNDGLSVRQEDVERYQELGFDDLTLMSRKSLIFADSLNATMGRKLTLDAPVIEAGAGRREVVLSAPWIVMTNSNSNVYAPQASAAAAVNGEFTLASSGWMDVIGSVQINDFQTVTLKADRDIRLSESLYSQSKTGGTLATKGDLVMDANTIYPGNFYSAKDGSNVIYPDIYSNYVIHADGTVTVQNSNTHVEAPIYSAGGSLTIEAGGGIDVEKGGYIAAPLGTITLSAPGQRIYLADGSRLTTAANVDEVNYGGIDPNNIWVTENKTNPTDLVFISNYFTGDSLPQKGVTLNADTTVAMNGSVIDVSGSSGGSIFAYKFQPGVQGSIDPLTKPNRYVAIKSDSFTQPGQTVTLQGAGLSGTYTLLDLNNPQNARFAFMPGAYIIEAQSGSVLSGAGSMSKDGHPLAIGYTGVADTSIRGTRPQVYSVRTAAEVLATEGNYVKQSFASGDGGNISITGNTIVLNGSFNCAAMAGSTYHGGKLSLSGLNITVQKEAATELTGFKFGDPGSNLGSLQNTLTLSTDGLSGQGFREVDLGDVNGTSATNSITVKAGADLAADVISLGAAGAGVNSSITLEAATANAAGAKLTATTGDGRINLTTPGKLYIDSDAVAHSSNLIRVDVNDVDGIRGSGNLQANAIMLKSNAIFFGSGGKGPGDIGLYLTADQLSKFTGFNDITFASRSDIEFRDSFNLTAPNNLTLDAARILDTNTNGHSDVTLNSATINLMNSGAVSQKTSSNAGAFTATADQINIGGGDVQFNGFSTLNLNSTNDVTLKGQGNLITNNADLHVTAARVVTGADSSSAKQYSAPNFIINAGTGAVTMVGSTATAATTAVPGGLLEIDAQRIELATVLQSDGGTIKLVTKGVTDKNDDGIFLKNGGKILARGTADASGGSVSLATDYVNALGNQQSGKITLDSGSLIDVSAGAQGDAGVISLVAPMGGVTLNGIIKGAAQSGKGGSLVLDTNEIVTVSSWHDILITKTDDQGNVLSGGFTETLDMRARNGNVTVDTDMQAHHFKLTADGGNIDVTGTITAEGVNGGSVELYAMNDLTIDGGIRAVSVSSNSKDPNVLLSSLQGSINVNGTIDVSDSSGKNASGVVYLRAQRYDNTGQGNDNDVKIYRNNGTLTGYKAIYVEAYKPYNLNTGIGNPDITINSQNVTINGVTSWINDAQTFYNNYSSSSNQNNNVAARLGIQPNSIHLLAGIDLYSSGDINWNTTWDQGSANGARFGGEPGVLTLRAGRNLNINQNLVDHPAAISGLNLSDASGNITYDFSARKSWGFNLMAGADTNSAEYLAVIKGKTDLTSGMPVGDLDIANGTVIYTESAPIHVASGNDTVIGTGYAAGYMINTYLAYTLASYDGSVHGNVGRDLVINGGAIQTATGDISINVGRDLQLNEMAGTLGTIRTTGRLSSTAAFGQDPHDPLAPAVATSQAPYATANDKTTYFWRYIDGGDITLDVGRAVGKSSSPGTLETAINSTQWDYFSKIKVLGIPGQSNLNPPNYGLFSANYGTLTATAGTRGFAAMGGGDVSIRTGGDFLAQTGTFGDGDLTIQSGGDVNGRFLNHGTANTPGQAEIHAMGNFGAYDSTKTLTADGRVQIELFNSNASISALGDMQIGAIVNPDLASGDAIAYRSNFVNCSYTPDTSISLKAGGDVTIAGIAPFYHTTNAADTYSLAINNEIVLPANVSVDARGDINLLNNVTLASSSDGNLRLTAGGDISGSNGSPVVMMSDIATDYWYGLQYLSDSNEKNGGWIAYRTWTNSSGYQNHHGYSKDADANKQATAEPLHSGDHVPIEIHAHGDIKNLNFHLPKKAEMTADRDIIDITYEGQNINTDDVSMIKAGRNISVKYVKDTGTSNAERENELYRGLIQGGPGGFLVQAGDSIDLGTLQDGVQSIGNVNNPILGQGNSSIMVLSGYDQSKTVDAAKFFREIRESGDLYGMLLAGGTRDTAEKLVNLISAEDTDAKHTDAYNAIVRLREKAGGDEDQFYKMLTTGGDKADADALLKDTRATTSGTLAPTGKGDINMTSTQISTSSGKSGVYIIANGDLNLGETALPIAGTGTKATGVTTNGGGSVNVFTKGDVNVNESRIMTFYGGDITVWSDNGNINAGRGSRTAVSPPKTRKIKNPTGFMTVYDPPSVGSGIRAVTYGDNPPPPGNIHLFAPSGIIDAAEAGIAGGQIYLAALKINNAANINYSIGSIGVPQSASGTANIGAMTGAGMVAQGSQLASEASGVAASKAQASQMMEDIMTKWLDVKVIDFVQQDDNSKEER